MTDAQAFWDSFADSYEGCNLKITIQGSKVLHSHMKLDTCDSILEVACGPGIGTLDYLQYNDSCKVVATDFSDNMIEKAKKTLCNKIKTRGNITIESANGMALNNFQNDQFDRYISGLCLQLIPDADAMLRECRRVLKPDGIAGFTIWGEEKNSGLFSILTKADALSGNPNATGASHPNFDLGRDVSKLKERFNNAGFSNFRLWPFWDIGAIQTAEEYVDFFLPIMGRKFENEGDEIQTKRKQEMLRLANEYLLQGKPIALEVYLILAW